MSNCPPIVLFTPISTLSKSMKTAIRVLRDGSMFIRLVRQTARRVRLSPERVLLAVGAPERVPSTAAQGASWRGKSGRAAGFRSDFREVYLVAGWWMVVRG
jgi:hypothetical protein